MKWFRTVPAVVMMLGLSAASASAADLVIERGRVQAIDAARKQVRVQTKSGERLVLTANTQSQLMIAGESAKLDEFRLGQPVRVKYVKEGDLNRLVVLRETVPAATDLGKSAREVIQSLRESTFENREEYEARLRDMLEDVDDRLEDLSDQAREAAGDARERLTERMEVLKQKRDALAGRLDRAKPAAAEAWDEFKQGVNRAADDLGRALERLRDDK